MKDELDATLKRNKKLCLREVSDQIQVSLKVMHTQAPYICLQQVYLTVDCINILYFVRGQISSNTSLEHRCALLQAEKSYTFTTSVLSRELAFQHTFIAS